MRSDEAEIHELKPRQEGQMPPIGDRWGRATATEAQLARERRRMNQQVVGRVAEDEARNLLAVLEQSVEDAEEGQMMRSMAAFAGNQELELKFSAVLRRLETAAAPARVRQRG